MHSILKKTHLISGRTCFSISNINSLYIALKISAQKDIAVKNLLPIYLCILFVLSLTGCKEDDSTDPCDGVICMNGGTCMGGECICPQRWSGVSCEEQVEPFEIEVWRIGLRRYPLTRPDGTDWDPDGGPDLAIEVRYGGQQLFGPFEVIYNTDGSQIYSWDMDIRLDTPGDEYQFLLWEIDDILAGDRELMGQMNFLSYTDDNGFPDIVEIDEGGDLAIRLFVEYRY